MADKVGIANEALGLISAERITDFSDPSPEGEAVRLYYETSKRAVLAAYPWRFASKRAALAASAEAPAFGYTHQFPLPADFIHIAEIDDLRSGEEWEVEGRNLLIDRAGPLNLVYIRDVAEGMMPEDFAKAFAAYLASELALTLPESGTMFERMIALYTARLGQAQLNNARHARAPKYESSRALTRSRFYNVG